MIALESAILKTISYFDVFDYPLTELEIWKWLYVSRWYTADGIRPTITLRVTTRGFADNGLQQVEIVDVLKVLETGDYLKERISAKNGFYFLRGREKIVEARMERYRLAEHKFHRAKRIIKFLRFVPFVRMIGVCNTLAYNNSRRDGDIDLFIVTARNRVWQGRFWVTGFLRLFKLRPRPDKTRDTICPTFFVDEDHLDIHEFAINEDIYLPYWIAQVVPVYDEGVYQKFIGQNEWVRSMLPHAIPIMPTSRRLASNVHRYKAFFELQTGLISEKTFRGYQERIMPSGLRNSANKGSGVVVNDHVLKFHDNDRRLEYLTRWQNKVAELL